MKKANLRFTKRKLAIELSKLNDIGDPKLELEQYPTDPEVASELLWNAYMFGDLENKIVADLGAGNGILGIGALLLGARKVYFVEIDSDAINVLEENLSKYNFNNYKILNMDVEKFDTLVDTVVMNPPFGIQSKLSIKFLEVAGKVAKDIYMIYPDVEKARDILKDFEITVLSETTMKIQKLFYFHERDRIFTKVFLIKAHK